MRCSFFYFSLGNQKNSFQDQIKTLSKTEGFISLEKDDLTGRAVLQLM